MKVKWCGLTSTERKFNGGGPQGATFGIWEYLAQSNSNAECVEPENRFKFVDDLSVLEKINLLLIGLASFDCHTSVPSDLPTHNQFIPSEHLKSQEYLTTIKEWTEKQRMILNQKKTKAMIFNFTEDYQFSTRLNLNGENLEVVSETKLLGVMITDDLKWDVNTDYLVKKANARMQLLRKVTSFTCSKEDKREIYILYIRSILEQSSVVWHSSLTKQNEEDLERVQKSAVKLINGDNIENYEEALMQANLKSLKTRREELCKNFAEKCIKSDNLRAKSLFPEKDKIHQMATRNEENFKVNHANTGRLMKSSIPYMQRILNLERNVEKKRKISYQNNVDRKRRKPG